MTHAPECQDTTFGLQHSAKSIAHSVNGPKKSVAYWLSGLPASRKINIFGLASP